MIITNQNTIDSKQTETQQQRQEKKDVQRSSDRFASMLDSQRKQQQQFDKIADKANKELALKTNDKDELVAFGSNKDAVGEIASSSTSKVEAGNISEPASSIPDIQKLAEEFGHQIQLHRLSGNTQIVDINFHSKTFPGLKVQIRQSNGQLAIRLLSQSADTTQLLAKHTASLQETLEKKGLNIASITLVGSRYPMNISGNASATV